MKLRDRICVAIGGAAMLTGVLAVGGALRWTQAVVVGLVTLALATQVLAKRRLSRTSPLLVFLGIATVLTAIQLIPLPAGIAEIVNSTADQLRTEGAALSQTHPWRCISLDPAATLRSLAFFATLFAIAALVLRYAAAERGRYAMLAGVAITCGIAAAVTGVHTLLNADLLYGVYEPQQFVHAPPVFGPLLNPNHLGGLMAIGAVLSLGLAFYGRQVTQARVLWIVIGLGCVLVCAASASRGAMIGLVFGLVIAGVITVASRVGAGEGRHRHRIRRDLPLLLVVGIGLAVVLYASAGGVLDQLNKTSVVELDQPSSKYAAWKASVKLIEEAPLFGIGRGAEELALTRVFRGSAYFTYSHLENEYLSAVVDWGIVGGVLLAGAFGWCVVAAARRWRDGPLSAAALGALAAIMTQSLVDFGIELFGVAIPVTIIAATVQLVPLRPNNGSVVVLRVKRALGVLALAALTFALTRPLTRSIEEDHEVITDAKPEPTMDQLREIVERHPMDYVGFGELATVRFEADNNEAVGYLNHALLLHPTHLGLHRLAGRLLAGVHRYTQASLEYSLAISADATPLDLITECVAVLPTSDDIANAIPTDYPKLEVILHSLHELNRDDIAMKWLARVAQRPQHDTAIMDMLYEMAMEKKDYPAAKATAELRLGTARTIRSKLMLAKVQFQLHELDPLLKDLNDVATWNGPINDKAEAWFILCDVHIARRDWDSALQCIHRIDASGLLSISGREGVTRRLQMITDARTHDSKMEQVEAMKKKYGLPTEFKDSKKPNDLPTDGVMPKIQQTNPTPPPDRPTLGIPPPPTGGIPNPFAKH